MQQIIALLLALMMVNEVAIAADVGKEQQTAIYHYDEYVNMTYCVGLADTFFSVAVQKADGVSKEDIKKYYASKKSSDENLQIQLATIEKVYSNQKQTPWDLASSFFGECAVNLAKIPVVRVQQASFCNQNTFIGDVAFGYKVAGKSQDEAIKELARFDSSAMRSIVDLVYKRDLNRAELKMTLWESCMLPLTDQHSPDNNTPASK